MSPRCYQETSSCFVSSWQRLFYLLPSNKKKQKLLLFMFFFLFLPLFSSWLHLTFICTCYRTLHTYTHRPEKEASVFRRQKLLFLRRGSWSFRLKAYCVRGERKGRRRAMNTTRSEGDVHVCYQQVHFFHLFSSDPVCFVLNTLNPSLQLCLSSFSGAFHHSLSVRLCVCVVRVVHRECEGTEFVSAWCEPVNHPPLPVRLIGRRGASSVLTLLM